MPAKGQHPSDETRRKQSAAAHVRRASQETKDKMSRARKGRPGYRGMLGKTHSPETKLKMSLTRKKLLANDSALLESQVRNLKRSRRTETSLERTVKEILCEFGVEFFQEYYIEDVGRMDFYVPYNNLMIECDGLYWHSQPTQVEKDKSRNRKLNELGFNLLRLPEAVISNRQKTSLLIYDALGG